MIRALAESQHQVLVLTTLDPATIDVAHPRLTIARPAPSWRADNLPRPRPSDATGARRIEYESDGSRARARRCQSVLDARDAAYLHRSRHFPRSRFRRA